MSSQSCLVLKDSDVHNILMDLSKDQILTFQDELKTYLKDFSIGEERKFQPEPGIINRPEGSKVLFRPFTSSTSVGTKIVVTPAPDPRSGVQGPLHGILTLCDSDGVPTGIINAEEVTGYRTSLCAMIPYMWRERTENVVIFGAGKQALWHARLVLALRGAEVASLTIINRSQDRAQQLIQRVCNENRERWQSQAQVEYLNPGNQQKLQKVLARVDVVFCTVPSREPLFPASYLTARSCDTLPLVSAIGSWQPEMIELDPKLLQHVSDDKEGYSPKHNTGGSILVDDRDSALHHTGEFLQSGLLKEKTIELGEVLGLQDGVEAVANENGIDGLQKWLAKGFLIYKSTGVSVMDLASGNAILKIAREKRLGIAINDF